MTDPSMSTSTKTAGAAKRSIEALHVVVIVLGDLGRSPRMQYHALSLLQEGHRVSIVGYRGEDLIPDLLAQQQEGRLRVVRFSTSSPKVLRKILPIYFAWRLLSVVGGLVWALWAAVPTPVDCLLVQNPPAVPLLFLSYLYCIWNRVWTRHQPALIIDWHNLGYSMLPKGSRFQRLARTYEEVMAPCANGHFCVTSAMKAFLESEMGVKQDMIRTLYDCPPTMFRPLTLAERHEFLSRMHRELCANCPRSWYEPLDPTSQTLLTERSDGRIALRCDRPALVTSSTSWTADEDFGILLDALVTLDDRLSNEASNLQILVVVTGKGPMKSMYEEKISRLSLRHVAIQTLWLKPTDYPRLLACADLGISLHTSTSGLDLPMKVLDLFGCQVPVLAYNFDCLSELVQDGVNGQVFETSAELANQMQELLSPLARQDSKSLLTEYSRNLRKQLRWDKNWKENALPLLERVVSKRHSWDVQQASI